MADVDSVILIDFRAFPARSLLIRARKRLFARGEKNPETFGGGFGEERWETNSSTVKTKMKTNNSPTWFAEFIPKQEPDGLLLRSLQQTKWRIMGLVPTRPGGLMLGRIMIVFAVAVGAAIFASSAAADKPRRTEFTGLTFSSVLTGVCSFPVAVDATLSGFEIDHFDKSGALTRIFVHQVEQDTFTANGKMLVGIPYTINAEILFDSSGNVTNNFGSGVVEKIPLPDGSLFVSAGRLDFANHPGVTFLLSPDKGNPGNVAGFCAALSP